MTSTSGKNTGKSAKKATFKKFAKLALMTCALALGHNTHTFAQEQQQSTINIEQSMRIGSEITRNWQTPFEDILLRNFWQIAKSEYNLTQDDKKILVNATIASIKVIVTELDPDTASLMGEIESALGRLDQQISTHIETQFKQKIKDAQSVLETGDIAKMFQLTDMQFALGELHVKKQNNGDLETINLSFNVPLSKANIPEKSIKEALDKLGGEFKEFSDKYINPDKIGKSIHDIGTGATKSVEAIDQSLRNAKEKVDEFGNKVKEGVDNFLK